MNSTLDISDVLQNRDLSLGQPECGSLIPIQVLEEDRVRVIDMFLNMSLSAGHARGTGGVP